MHCAFLGWYLTCCAHVLKCPVVADLTNAENIILAWENQFLTTAQYIADHGVYLNYEWFAQVFSSPLVSFAQDFYLLCFV